MIKIILGTSLGFMLCDGKAVTDRQRLAPQFQRKAMLPAEASNCWPPHRSRATERPRHHISRPVASN
jgi:hypothetical protein